MALSDSTLAQAADAGASALPLEDAVLYKNERTLIMRRPRVDGSTVIVKKAFGTDAQTRLRHEAAILVRLANIQGVVQLTPDQHDGELIFVDEQAESLAKWLINKKLSVPQQIQLAIELALVLSQVHKAGVIHKDINPANILLSGADKHPVLIDFNISSCFAQERLGFTHQSHIAGTLAYMPPEQTGRTGRAVDQRSDLYALGVTLYELATGRKPFESEDLLEMIHDHLVRQPVPPLQVQPDMPQALSDIIMRLLEKEADRRYQSAEGLSRDLSRLRYRLGKGDTSSFPLGQDDFPLRLTPPSTLVGRKAEIRTLQEAIDRTGRGEGRALLVSGAPGVGKSALINELQPMVTARRGWFVMGKFEQYQRDTTSAFVQALRALGRLLLAEPEAQLQRHRQRILKALGANAGLGPSLLPEFQTLLGKLPRVVVDDPVEAETRMIQASVDMLKSIVSPEQPLVMVVDDLQWAPPLSLRFMDALLTNDRELQGLLLVGAYREAEVDGAHPLNAMLARWDKLGVAPPIMRLDNLPQGDVGELIGEMLRLPTREATRLGEALIERTDGNPYDTVELINALRQDGLLTPVNGNWDWDEAAIRHYVGDCDVVGLLGRRIDRLPPESQELMSVLACLGGEVNTDLLGVASGMRQDVMEARLFPALEDGLLVSHNSHEREIRFRHDRVQQAMHERMLAGGSKSGVQLAMARRLAAHPKLSALAAKQYLPTHEDITDPQECRRVIGMFQVASVANKVINYDLCERFLSAAITLLSRVEMDDGDRALQYKLLVDRHAALYGLGKLDDADKAYEAIVATSPDPLTIVDTAAVQIASLSNRSRHKDAMALGLDLLKQFGMDQPEDIKMAIGMSLFKMATWIASPDKEQDLTRAEVSDPRILAIAKVLSKTQVAAFFCSAKTGSWLTMESHGLWVEHGPCPALMMTLSSTPLQLMAIAEDYQGAYALSRHLIKVGEARRYEPATSVARFLYAMCVAHWYDPIEDAVPHYRKSREGLFQAGELQYGMFTYGLWSLLFETQPNLGDCLEEIKTGFVVCARTGDQNFLQLHRPSYQLYKALHGDIRGEATPGSFNDAEFNEAEHEATITAPSVAGAYFHISRATSAAIFNDPVNLHRHTAATLPLLQRVTGNLIAARAQALHALSLAQRLQALPLESEERAPIQAELDKSLKWHKRRAKDAPSNFQHLHHWIEAERAWAMGEHWAATEAFNTAMNVVSKVSRPWHRALITERAARFHLAQGMEHTGMPLMRAAHHAYEAWGAKGKIMQLHEEFPALRARNVRKAGANARSTIVSTDMVDVMSVLRASQALSSETNLERLNSRVNKVLGAMTGAASVQLVVRSSDLQSWQVFVSDGDKSAMVTLDEAAQHGRLPLSAFQYAERTREPLLLSEATTDERFSRDPYFEGVKQCSMLLLPVLSKGELRAILLLENRLSRGAFSSDRLDAVSLIAGQLSVSLDNAMLYASLEQKVAERTAALEEANQRLELLSSTDALTGVSNRRKFNEALDAEWLRAKRTKQPIGLILIDIDHFKLYNDQYGHQGGDACLQMVAAAMRVGLRAGSDLIARYGGEEFVLLLPNTDLEGTHVVAERVRAAVEGKAEPHMKSSFGIVTISVGITSFIPTQDAKPSQYIEVADQALYEAKRSGRNRVCKP
jgi:diguanylate cyclase (GGDEF)-like protein